MLLTVLDIPAQSSMPIKDVEQPKAITSDKALLERKKIRIETFRVNGFSQRLAHLLNPFCPSLLRRTAECGMNFLVIDSSNLPDQPGLQFLHGHRGVVGRIVLTALLDG